MAYLRANKFSRARARITGRTKKMSQVTDHEIADEMRETLPDLQGGGEHPSSPAAELDTETYNI